MSFPFRWALGATVLTSSALAGMMLAGSASLAQGQGKTDVPRPNLAEVRFGDGSLVRVTILQDDLEVMTKYGKLTIPLREIRRIDFGLHLPDGVGQQIDQSIKLLGSET